MEASHGSVHRSRSAFLSGRDPRSSQPARTATPPLGHPRLGVWRPHVRREELRGDRPMEGAGPGHHAEASTRLHAQAPQGGGDPQGPDRLGRDGLRGRVDPGGRDEPAPADPTRARTPGGVRPRRQVGPGQFRRPGEGRASALPEGPRIGPHARSEGRAPRRRGQDQRAQDGAAVARRGGPGGARGHRRRPLLPARPLPAGHRRPGALPVVRQGEPTDPPGRHRGGLRPFGGRGFFPLGSGGPGRKRWRPRRPSTRGMAGANAGR